MICMTWSFGGNLLRVYHTAHEDSLTRARTDFRDVSRAAALPRHRTCHATHRCRQAEDGVRQAVRHTWGHA